MMKGKKNRRMNKTGKHDATKHKTNEKTDPADDEGEGGEEDVRHARRLAVRGAAEGGKKQEGGNVAAHEERRAPAGGVGREAGGRGEGKGRQ